MRPEPCWLRERLWSSYYFLGIGKATAMVSHDKGPLTPVALTEANLEARDFRLDYAGHTEVKNTRRNRLLASTPLLALALIMVPSLARSTEDFIRLVPTALREASLALGVPGWKTSLRVIIPTALGGIVTAVLLAALRSSAPMLVRSRCWYVVCPRLLLTVEVS